jgi:hypothetical protein
VTTSGIEGFFVGTHNWGATAAFWKSLGFAFEFETDHRSGLLRHPSGGPYILLAERPETEELFVQPVLSVESAAAFEAPSSGTVERGFEPQHWGVLEMLVADPDGRSVSIQAPLSDAAALAQGH